MDSQGPKVLVVDDEGQYLNDFFALFSKKFNIVVAKGGEEALHLLEKEDVAVVISDQRMPRMTGDQLLTVVAQRYPKTVRILLSGYCNFDALVEAVNGAQIFRYLTKDVPVQQIESTIRQAIEKYKQSEFPAK